MVTMENLVRNINICLYHSRYNKGDTIKIFTFVKLKFVFPLHAPDSPSKYEYNSTCYTLLHLSKNAA